MPLETVGGVTKLFSKTDWVLADVSGSPYVGADGTLGAIPSALSIFDLRQYSAIYAYVYSAGYTGATALQFRVIHFDSVSPHPGNFVWAGSLLSKGMSTGAAGETICLYDSITGYASTGVANINEGALTIGPKPLFAQFQLLVTGTMSALTAGMRVFVYGTRRPT